MPQECYAGRGKLQASENTTAIPTPKSETQTQHDPLCRSLQPSYPFSKNKDGAPMMPAQYYRNNSSEKQPDSPVKLKGDGTQPLEGQYNRLLTEYNSFAANHNAAQDNAYMQQLSSNLQKSGVLPSLALVWGDQKIGDGAKLTGDEIQKYTSGQVGNAFDQTMANSLKSQFDQLGTQPWMDWNASDKNITGDTLNSSINTLDQQIIAADRAKAGTTSDTSTPADTGPSPNTSPTMSPTMTPGDTFNQSSQTSGSTNSGDFGLPFTNQGEQTTNSGQSSPAEAACLKSSGAAQSTGESSLNSGSDNTVGNNSGTSSDNGAKPSQYQVKKGDSLWSIAANLLQVPNDKRNATAIYQMTKKLEALNPHLNPTRLHIGQSIDIGQQLQDTLLV